MLIFCGQLCLANVAQALPTIDGRKKHPRKKQHHDGQQIKPRRSCVVEGGGVEATKLVFAKHVVEHAGVLTLSQHKPRQSDQHKQQHTADPRQAQNFAPLMRPRNPHHQHQAGQQQTNQAFAEHTQSTGHKTRARPTGMHRVVRFIGMHESTRKTPDGHTHPSGHHHVVVDILATDQKRQTAAQHPSGPLRCVDI